MNSNFAWLDPASQRVAHLLFDDPSMSLRELDLQGNRAVFVPMNRAGYLASSFLDSRAVRADAQDRALPLGALLQLLPRIGLRRRPANVLFHIGHCGSTMLSRLLAEIDGAFPLREPPPLFDLAQMHRFFGTPRMALTRDQWRQLFEFAMACFTRMWGAAETAMIKPMSDSNNLLTELLDWHPQCRGVLLYVDLPTYIASMLAPANRMETRMAIAESRSRDFQILSQGRDLDCDKLDDAQAAAFVWLLQMREFRVVSRAASLSDRLLPVHFDDFLRDPLPSFERIVTFFGLHADQRKLETILHGKVMHSYSKSPGSDFSPAQRAEKLNLMAERHADEIERALSWAQSFVDAYPMLLTEPDGLHAQARIA